jgi:RNA polymerase sigma-70 factor (ECF subfamily)
MTPTLDQTLAAAATGDPTAWRSIIDQYSGRVYGLLLRQCGDADLAEEITQATFVKVVGKLDQYHEQGRFEAWLFRIAVNRLRDEIRRRRRQARPMDFDETPPEVLGTVSGAPGPGEAMDRDEQAVRVRACVARLPEADRQVLEMRYTGELTFAQIAEVLEEPLGTVLARGHRALKKLRELMKEMDLQ